MVGDAGREPGHLCHGMRHGGGVPLGADGFLIGREGPRLKPLSCVAAIQGHECPCSLRVRALRE